LEPDFSMGVDAPFT